MKKSFISILLFAGLLVLLFPANATAVDIPNPIDIVKDRVCKEVPEPQTPNPGLFGSIDKGPTNPKNLDPFDPKNKTTIYEVYGLGGTFWIDYENCDKLPIVGDIPAYMLQGIVNNTTLAVQFTRWTIDPKTAGFMDPTATGMVTLLGYKIFFPLLFIPILLTSLAIGLKLDTGDIKTQLNEISWSFFIASLAIVAIIFPLVLINGIDTKVRDSITYVSSALSKSTTSGQYNNLPDAMAGIMQKSIVLPTWETGYFGSNEKAKDKYSMKLFKASALTRTEYKSVKDNNALRKKLIEKKKTEYESVVEEIKREYPDVYKNISGDNYMDRLTASFLGGSAWFSSSGTLILMSGFLFLVSFAMRWFWVFIPLIGLLASFPRTRWILIEPIKFLLKANLMAVIFGVVCVVQIAFQGVLVFSGLDPILIMVIQIMLFITTIVGVIMLWKGFKKKRAYRQYKEFTGTARQAVATTATFVSEKIPNATSKATAAVNRVRNNDSRTLPKNTAAPKYTPSVSSSSANKVPKPARPAKMATSKAKYIPVSKVGKK